MRIAMVSEHASPLAVLGGRTRGGRTSTSRRSATGAGGTRPRRRRLHATRRPRPAGAGTARRRACRWCTSPAGPRVRHRQGRHGSRSCRSSASWLAEDWRRRRRAGHRPRALLDVRPGHDGRPRAPRRTARAVAAHGRSRSTPSGSSSAVTWAQADPSPAERLDVERSLLSASTAWWRPAVTRSASCSTWAPTPRRLHVVPCGVDLQRFAPRGAAPGSVDRRLRPAALPGPARRAQGHRRRRAGPGRPARARSWWLPAAPTCRSWTPTPTSRGCAPLRRRGGRRLPRALRRAGAARRRRRADARGRPRARRALVRAVRHRAAGGAGVRDVRRRHRGRRHARHGRRRRRRGLTCRRATRTRSRQVCARCCCTRSAGAGWAPRERDASPAATRGNRSRPRPRPSTGGCCAAPQARTSAPEVIDLREPVSRARPGLDARTTAGRTSDGALRHDQTSTWWTCPRP